MSRPTAEQKIVTLSTEELTTLVSNETRRAVNKALRRYTRGSIAGFVILLVGVAIALHEGSNVAADNKAQGIAARSVICRILQQGDEQTYTFQRDGTITQAQLHRALEASASYRTQLGPAPNCVSAITPPAPANSQPAPATTVGPHKRG